MKYLIILLILVGCSNPAGETEETGYIYELTISESCPGFGIHLYRNGVEDVSWGHDGGWHPAGETIKYNFEHGVNRIMATVYGHSFLDTTIYCFENSYYYHNKINCE